MNSIKLFESKKIRSVWNEEEQKWCFSIIDIIRVLTESNRPRKYWNDLKKKLFREGYEQLSEKIGQLKLESDDGKKYITDVAHKTDAQGFPENKTAAKKGGKIAGNAREALEKETGKKVVSKENYLQLTGKQKRRLK